MAEPDFVEALLAAPVGVALLAMLEAESRRDVLPWQVPTDSDPHAVAAAVDAVAGRSLGSLLSKAVDAATVRVGPWIADAPDALSAAYRHAEARAPIARAIDACFGVDLHATLAMDAQQWWHSGPPDGFFLRPRFTNYAQVYGAGQFTWAGVWTVSDPPRDVHADLISAWELELGSVSRWHLPVRPGAAVFEVHRPQDWASLVQAHPATGRTYGDWELPGPNHDPGRLQAVLRVSGQRAARASVRQQLVPDWEDVAAAYDGVHLSWAGFLTSEGCVTDVAGGDVTMLRYWFSERTLWLRDVFGEPVPLDAPDVDTDCSSIELCDVRTDRARRRDDRTILAAQLGRP